MKVPVNIGAECIKSLDAMFNPKSDDEEECKTKKKRISSSEVIVERSCICTDETSKTVGEMNLN